MASLSQMLQSESQQEEEGIPPLSPLAPAICLHIPSPQASSLKHLHWWLRNLTVHFTRFAFDSFSHQVLSYFLCFLPCGWGPASSSAQQAEPGEAITAPKWTPLSLKGAFLGGSPGTADLFSQGFMIASPPVPRGIWLQLCSPLGLFYAFYPLPACLLKAWLASPLLPGHQNCSAAPLQLPQPSDLCRTGLWVFLTPWVSIWTQVHAHTCIQPTVKTPLDLSLSTA